MEVESVRDREMERARDEEKEKAASIAVGD